MPRRLGSFSYRGPGFVVVGFERGIGLGVCSAVDHEETTARVVRSIWADVMDGLAVVDQGVAGLENADKRIGVIKFFCEANGVAFNAGSFVRLHTELVRATGVEDGA